MSTDDAWAGMLNEDGSVIESNGRRPVADPNLEHYYVGPTNVTPIRADVVNEEREPRRLNLDAYLDGTFVPEIPEVGAYRDDGVQLLYKGRWHTCVALNTAGKSWLALFHCKSILDSGGTVVYCHFEEVGTIGPKGTVLRMLGMGVDRESIRERFVWLDCARHWESDEFRAELEALGVQPDILVLDGINAACTAQGWPISDPESVSRYRSTFVRPATHLGAAVFSLGHTPKDPNRQEERHGYGSTAWLDEVDGAGFRLEGSKKAPLRRNNIGWTNLYCVKDRQGGVNEFGMVMAERDPGWYDMGSLQVDDRGATTEITLQTPKEREVESRSGTDPLSRLALEVHAIYMAEGVDPFFNKQAEIHDRLKLGRVRYRHADLTPAMMELEAGGCLEWPDAPPRKPRPGLFLPKPPTVTEGDDDQPRWDEK